MQYVCFARKYRPKVFIDLIGQEVLTKTLQYCIEHNQLASSFLFTGIRGIGKTTAARIVAQTINCINLQKEQNSIASCQQCPSCLGFQDSSHPDIIEFDAASYTSVENIRDIIEKVGYKPILSKYKVFIIDEVHMLSKSAFNALLKTLEEPPAHVIFILLTTEIHRVPITILSRCQKFSLKRFSIDDLVLLMEKICITEKISYEKQALEAIAYKADGSARDATVLLEQASFLSRQKMTALDLQIITESLDLHNFHNAIDFLELILAQNAKASIDLINQLYKENFDATNLISAIIELISLLSKMQITLNYNMSYFKAYEDQINSLSKRCDLGFLTSLWQIFTKGMSEISASQNQLISFEMLLIKAIYCSIIPSPAELIEQNDQNFQSIEYTKMKIEQHQKNPILPDVAKAQSHKLEPVANPQVNTLSIKNQITGAYTDLNSMDEKIFRFIKHLYDSHLFQLYHFIMNECQITEFKDGSIKISAAKFDANIKAQLADGLKNWDNKEWQIIGAVDTHFVSLQNELKNKAAVDKDFQGLSSAFPTSKITDIWLNFLNK